MNAKRICFVLLIIFACSAAPASAGTAAPAWLITTVAAPTVMPAGVGQPGRFTVVVENVGGAESNGTTTLKDVLSPGASINRESLEGAGGGGCAAASGSEVQCSIEEPVAPGAFFVLNVYLETTAEVAAVKDTATLSGGGAGSESQEASMRVGAGHEKGPGGIAGYGFDVSGAAGGSDLQAGGHPAFATSTALFNDEAAFPGEIGELSLFPIEHVKDLNVYLPLGFFGNPQLLPRCTVSLVESEYGITGCPAGSRVGAALLMILGDVFANTDDPSHVSPLFNVTPEKGYAAEFGFSTSGFTYVVYANVVRRDGAYVLRISLPGAPLFSEMFGAITTFDGDVHGLTSQGQPFDEGGFLTNPGACGNGPLDSTLEINTWEHPETHLEKSAVAYPNIEGCDLLGFAPAFSATPETTQAEAPSSYHVDVEVPQAPQSSAGLSTPPIREMSVAFPAGTTVSPSAANGLAACQEAGPEGIDIEGPESEAPAADGEPRPVAGHCPAASRIGTVKASTPLLSEPLEGHIFLAAPKCGGADQPECTAHDAEDGKLFGLYAELEAPDAGVIVKVPGSASVNPVTGRVTATFQDIPQFPLSDLSVGTNGGPRAPLANPTACETASSSAQVTPWSSTSPDVLSSSFNVDWEGSGGGCPASAPFAPVFTAGTTQDRAGAFSPFTLTLRREDREQNISSLSATLPPGLLAIIAKTPQCPEPQAADGGCPAASQVGSVAVSVGPGGDPLPVTGRAYFTGPTAPEGPGQPRAPFGLSVVIPAVAGPFNLGNVIVRVALYINPSTGQVTAISGTGVGGIPTIIDGIPLRIRTLSINLDAPGFTFNPTSCNPLSVTATIASNQGASKSVSSPFATSSCRSLPFKPTFSASTAGRASKAAGASLDVKVTSKGGPQAGGGEANIKSVKVDLPKQLPSRLTTLQRACTEAQFNANPAGCPKASDVGTASANTPVLTQPLAGPAYLVSHGGEAFPNLEIVLQGEGITLVLDGNTSIKKGITSSTFKTIPDAPISSFELKLPTGKYSILGADLPQSAKYDLCGQTLAMPTAITGQNGAVIKQTTKVGVTGCPQVKKAKKAVKQRRGKKGVNGHRVLPMGGHRFSPVAAIFSPHWWPSVLPGLVG